MPVVIGITTAFREKSSKQENNLRIRPARPEVFLSQALISRVRAVGGEPVLLPPGGMGLMKWAMNALDGVIVSGGAFDIHPSLYGQEVEARLDDVQAERSLFELELIRCCVAESMPLLGICGGMQALAVAMGGSLIQDIASQCSNALEHEQPNDPAEAWHAVELSDPWFVQRYEKSRISVNSTHHQAVLDAGVCKVSGRSSDGVVEAIRHPNLEFCAGVQWHPELRSNTLFQALIEHVESRR